MNWELFSARRAAWCTALVASLCLAACSTTTSTSSGPSGTQDSSRDNGPGKDITTASDETDAHKRAHVRMELAEAYFGQGQLTTALDEVKQAISADPSLASAFNLRGLIYAGLGDDRLAEDSFRHAQQLDPRDPDTMHNFGWYLCQHQRYVEADELFRKALARPQYRDSTRTLLAQGVCQARASQWAEAETTLQRAYERDPSNPATAVNLAEVLYHRGDLERARFYIRRVNNGPDLSNAQTLWLAARIEHKLGNRQGTQDFGTQLRNRFPQSREWTAFDRGDFDD